MDKSTDLSWTFDTVAKTYEKIRPCYPQKLYDELFKTIHINSSFNAIEIGIGGGQATLPFFKTGCNILALEYGKNLTELCNDKFKNFNNFKAINTKFEDYKGNCNNYDLIYSASAFHWIDEKTGYEKAYNMLGNGGYFVLFAHHPYKDIKNTVLWNEIQKLYAIYMPSVKPPNKFSKKQASDRAELSTKYGFLNLGYKIYEFSLKYTSNQYIELLSTYSDHIALVTNIRTEFFNKIKNIIDDNGGILNMSYTVDMEIAKKP